MARISLPRAKYGDSIIVREENELRDAFVNEVRGKFDEDGELYWVYWKTGKEGATSQITDDDILMNLTTRQQWEDDFLIIEDN